MATIYKLGFGSGDTYIGQTVRDPKLRLQEHVRTQGKGSPKLELAWQTQEFLGMEVLETTTLDEVDVREVYWIEKLEPSLNTLPGGKAMRGLNHPKIKYSEEQLRSVVELFKTNKYSIQEVSELTQVGYNTVHDILKGRKHTWLTNNENVVKKLYTFYDKYNRPHSAYVFRDIELANNVPSGTLSRVYRGQKNHSGWSLELHKVYELTTPEGLVFEQLTRPEAEECLELANLSRFSIEQLLDKQRPSKGYKAKLIQQ